MKKHLKTAALFISALLSVSIFVPSCVYFAADTAVYESAAAAGNIKVIESGASAEEIQGEIYNLVGTGSTIKLVGEFELEHPLVLCSGQTLDATDAVISCDCEYAVNSLKQQDVCIKGGTWNIKGGYFTKISGCSNVSIDSVTINGGGVFDYGNIFSYSSDNVVVSKCTLNNSAATAVYAYKSTNFTVVDTKVNKADGHGIRIFASDNIRILGNTLDGINGDGLNISTCDKGGNISGNLIKNVTVNNKLDIDPLSKISRSGCGIAISKCNDMKVGMSFAFNGSVYENNNVAGCAADGLHINVSKGTIVNKTNFSYISGDGIHNSASRDTTVKNCYFKVIKGSAMSFVPGPSASVAGDYRLCQNSVITNNKIDTTNAYGILLSKTDGIKVNDNNINNCKEYGIAINSSNNITALCNNITKTMQKNNSGVSVTNDSKNVTVINNSDVKITLDKAYLSLGKGESYTLKATVKPDALPDKSLTWESSDTSIAVVKNGKVTSKATGVVNITAKNKSGATAVCRVTVQNAPQSVTLTKTAVSIGVGEKFSVASVLPSGSAAADRWYSSSDSSIVKMTKTYWTGEFVGQKVGVANVTVKLYNGKTATCRVNVMAAPTSVSLPKKSITIGVGESYSFGATLPKNTAAASRTFSSSDNSVVKMTKTSWMGTFTGVKPGTAKVSVTLYNGKKAECIVYVKAAPKSVSLSKKEITLKVGETASLSAILPANTGAAERTYRTNNSSVVKLLSTSWVCNFKALKPGTALISVKLYNGKSAVCKITVK